MTDADLTARLQATLDAMPPVRAMQFRVDRWTGDTLRLVGPLPANVNDKGCAFGGSLAGLLTLSAWGLVSLRLDAAGFGPAEVYVQDSTMRYLAPLYDDLVAEARLADGQSWDGFLAAFASKGRARATLVAVAALPDGQPATTFEGRFVALRPKAG